MTPVRAAFIGGPFDGRIYILVGVTTRAVVHVGDGHEHAYDAILDPDDGRFLGGYVYVGTMVDGVWPSDTPEPEYVSGRRTWWRRALLWSRFRRPRHP